jgi:PqqD family protein of HPr-rel-A system
MIATPAAGELTWVDWDDVYIVYQPSSAETHVFNETTALILKVLQQGVLSLTEVIDQIGQALEAEEDELIAEDVRLAVQRLEVLGLIDGSDGIVTGP